jgi:hypothetical protein
MAIFKRFLLLSLVACLGLAGSTLGRVSSEHSIIGAQEEEEQTSTSAVLPPKKFSKRPSSIEKNQRNDALPSKIETKAQYNDERKAKHVPQKQYRRRDREENVRKKKPEFH